MAQEHTQGDILLRILLVEPDPVDIFLDGLIQFKSTCLYQPHHGSTKQWLRDRTDAEERLRCDGQSAILDTRDAEATSIDDFLVLHDGYGEARNVSGFHLHFDLLFQFINIKHVLFLLLCQMTASTPYADFNHLFFVW